MKIDYGSYDMIQMIKELIKSASNLEDDTLKKYLSPSIRAINEKFEQYISEDQKNEKESYSAFALSEFQFKKAGRASSENKRVHFEFPFEVANLFAAFVALKYDSKTFDYVSQDNYRSDTISDEKKSEARTKMKHNQIKNTDNTSKVEIEAIITFFRDYFYSFDKLSDIEKKVFSYYMHQTDVITSFDFFNCIIMLVKEFYYFIITLLDNCDSSFIKPIEDTRLFLKNYTQQIDICNKLSFLSYSNENELNVSNGFVNIYMAVYDCYCKSINHILSITHHSDGSRKTIDELMPGSDEKMNTKEKNTFTDLQKGKRVTDKRISELKDLLKDIFDEAINKSTDITDHIEWKCNRSAMYKTNYISNELAEEFTGFVDDYIHSFFAESLDDKDEYYRKQIEHLNEIYSYASKYDIMLDISNLINTFTRKFSVYISFHKESLTNITNENQDSSLSDFIQEQKDLIVERLEDIIKKNNDDIDQYKTRTNERVSDDVLKGAFDSLSVILTRVSKEGNFYSNIFQNELNTDDSIFTEEAHKE